MLKKDSLLKRNLVPLCLLGAAPLALLMQTLAFSRPDVTEALYSARIYPILAQAVSLVTGVLPFSLAEWLVVLLPLWLPALCALFYRGQRKRHASRGESALGAFTRVGALASCLYLVFMLLCGLNYARQPYGETAGYDTSPVSVQELKKLCDLLADEANVLRAALPEDENGLYQLTESLSNVSSRTQQSFMSASQSAPWLGRSYGRPKLIALSEAMAYTQVTGVYFPFTAEANVNRVNSPIMYASTMAHEAAHQRGFMREDEANFIAWYVCRQSQIAYDRYSGTMLALIHAGNALYGADADLYWETRARYSKGVEDDLSAHSAFWRKYDGPVSEAQTVMNDNYLKANKQDEGVRSYGRMVDLLVAHMRAGWE